MPENHLDRLTPNGHRSAEQFHHGADRDIMDEDYDMVQLLQQSLALRYPVPDPEDTWQRVLSSHARSRASTEVPGARRHDSTLQSLVSIGAPPLLTIPLPHVAPAPAAYIPWRSGLAVLALAAVVVLGLLGSLRGVIGWSWTHAQRGDVLPTQEATSPDQDVLALEPAALQAQLGPGWRVVGTWAGVADHDAPAITGFVGSTRLEFGGPNGARLTLVIMPLALDTSATSKAWDWNRGVLDDTVQDQMDPQSPGLSTEPQDATVPGCAQALHQEGSGKVDWMYLVGVTLCTVDAREVILVTASGEILGREGSAASDQMATFIARQLAAAPIVPTHRSRRDANGGLFREPSRDASVERPLPPGAPLRWTGAFEQVNNGDAKGYWLQMQTVDGTEGWVSETALIGTPLVAEGASGP